MNSQFKNLIPNSILKAFAEQGYTGNKQMSEIKIICKLFNPCGAGTWWLYEHVEEDVYMAFCLLDDPTYAEIGTISLLEMKALRLPFGLGIERDIHFPTGEKTLKQIWDKVKEK